MSTRKIGTSESVTIKLSNVNSGQEHITVNTKNRQVQIIRSNKNAKRK